MNFFVCDCNVTSTTSIHINNLFVPLVQNSTSAIRTSE
nr:MAG TPA: hypothetical protein [Caudoviricetes sp.]